MMFLQVQRLPSLENNNNNNNKSRDGPHTSSLVCLFISCVFVLTIKMNQTNPAASPNSQQELCNIWLLSVAVAAVSRTYEGSNKRVLSLLSEQLEGKHQRENPPSHIIQRHKTPVQLAQIQHTVTTATARLHPSWREKQQRFKEDRRDE